MTDFPDFSEDYTYWTREGGGTLSWTSPRCARAVAGRDLSRVELFRGHRLPSEQWTGRDWVPAVDDKPGTAPAAETYPATDKFRFRLRKLILEPGLALAMEDK